MKTMRTRPMGEKGVTLVELMLVVALIAIITPAITLLFTRVTQGMAADEMRLQLQALNEWTMLRLHERFVASRHLFQQNASGVSFLGPVTTGMSATTKSQYPIMAGSLLGVTQPVTGTGSFSPVTAVAANFGNSVLMGVYDSAQTIGTKVYPGSVTIYGTGVTYSTNNTPATVVIDLYRFYYYYLTTKNPRPLRNTSSYRLVEWQSIQFADFNEISDISDGKLKPAVIKWLATPGNVTSNINPMFKDTTYAITNAWDPTQQNPNSNATTTAAAFYTLSTSGVATYVQTMNSIPEGAVTCLTKVSSGILSSGFRYGISPNSANWNGAPATVPKFAAANGNFPGGFEVGISGAGAGMQVLIRSLLAAQGSTPLPVWNDQSIISNVRDTW